MSVALASPVIGSIHVRSVFSFRTTASCGSAARSRSGRRTMMENPAMQEKYVRTAIRDFRSKPLQEEIYPATNLSCFTASRRHAREVHVLGTYGNPRASNKEID